MIDEKVLIERLEEEIKGFIEDMADGDYLRGNVNFAVVAKDIVTELAEEQNNGWINADVELPTQNGRYIVYYRKRADGNYLPKFDETEMRILRYRNSDWVFPTYADTEAEKDIHREVIAWQPLPAPYKQKEGRHNE